MKVIERLAAGADDAFPDAEGGAAELQPVTRSARAVVAAVATRNRRALRRSAIVFPSLFSAQGAVLRSEPSPGTYGDQLAGLRGVLAVIVLSLIHISEPTRLGMISYAVFCLKKKKKR